MSKSNDSNYSYEDNIINYCSLLNLNKNRHMDTTYKKNSKAKSLSHTQSQLQFLFPFSLSSTTNREVADDAFSKGTKLICNLYSEGKIDDDTAKDILSYFFEIYFDNKIGEEVDHFFIRHRHKSIVKALKYYLETENG